MLFKRSGDRKKSREKLMKFCWIYELELHFKARFWLNRKLHIQQSRRGFEKKWQINNGPNLSAPNWVEKHLHILIKLFSLNSWKAFCMYKFSQILPILCNSYPQIPSIRNTIILLTPKLLPLDSFLRPRWSLQTTQLL